MKIYRFDVKEKDWEHDIDGIIIARNLNRAWQCFAEYHDMELDELEESGYYGKRNWKVIEMDMQEVSHFHNRGS